MDRPVAPESQRQFRRLETIDDGKIGTGAARKLAAAIGAGIGGFDQQPDLAGGEAALDRLETGESLARSLGKPDEIERLTPAMLVALGEKGIKTLDDLADLAADELIDEKDGLLKDFGLSGEDANTIIMAARAHWFAETEAGA